MAKLTRTVRDIVAAPRILADEIARFHADTTCTIPASSREAIASTVRGAVRHALRVGESVADLAPRRLALAHDIRDLIPSLHIHARAAAKLKGHQDAADAEGRCHRFVEWLTGGRRYDERSRVDWPCPDVMRPLVAHSTQGSAASSLGLLWRLGGMTPRAAADAPVPERFPTYEQLIDAVLEFDPPVRAGVRSDRDARAAASARVANALSIYRKARERLLAAAPCEQIRQRLRAQYAPCPKPPVGRAVHVGVHDEVHDLVRDAGLVPEEMSPFEILRAVNPALAQDYELWATRHGAAQAPEFVAQCEDVLLRTAGWAVTAGRLPELRAATGIDDLLYLQVETAQRLEMDPRELRAALARGDDPDQLTTASAPLLLALVDAIAADALTRSPTVAKNLPLHERSGKPFVISGIYSVCVKLWKITKDLYGQNATSAKPGQAERWARTNANWGTVLGEIKARRVPGEYVVSAKDKEKLVKLVTLPQLLCVAFPMRRRELRALRARWRAAHAAATEKGHDPDTHPGVVAAERAYFDAAVPHMMLAITLDDGMRRQQYTHGRLGYSRSETPGMANFQPIWRRRGGRANGAIEGFEGMKTNWTGLKADPAHFKVRERGKDKKLDTRYGREVRGGTVDFEILWDLIRVWRPKQLVGAGAVPSLAAYDLEADMRDARWALFPSDQPVKRVWLSRTDVSEKVGRELHYVVRTFLRPGEGEREQIPAWEDLDESWRALWSQHVTRLLNTSYIGGVRERWGDAEYLMKDVEATLRGEYSRVNRAIKDNLGRNTSHWEHPHAYDVWMDRLLIDKEVFDPLEEPGLPLPDHIRQQLAEERAAARQRRPVPGARVRIRKPRPDQGVPPGAANAAKVNPRKTSARKPAARP